jgi:hypothetical protein
MLVWGTANPVGESHGYRGLRLRQDDIASLLLSNCLIGLPVKIEHKSLSVGKVVSAWSNSGKLDLLLQIDDVGLEGNILKQFVQGGTCKDLSLGYSVDVRHSTTGDVKTSSKIVKEVSIVRRGARELCHIHAFSH